MVKFAHPVAREMATRRKGRMVFVSSVLGYMSVPGFASYSGSKYAVRGLTDAIYEEMRAFGIDVHMFAPGTIDTPGLVKENEGKPKVSWDIEGSTNAVSAEKAASQMFHAMSRGEYCITTDPCLSLDS